jgi:hypothetical protein
VDINTAESLVLMIEVRNTISDQNGIGEIKLKRAEAVLPRDKRLSLTPVADARHCTSTATEFDWNRLQERDEFKARP